MMTRSPFLLAPLLLVSLATSALAQDAEPAPGDPPERIRNIQVVGDQPCPQAVGDEIVVCRRIDQAELYRIPEELRKARVTPANTAWASRVETATEVNRIGLPGSCSPVGSAAQTGCTAQFLQQMRAIRAGDARAQ